MAILADQSQKVILQGVWSETSQLILNEYKNRKIRLVGVISAGKGGGWSPDGKIPVFDSVKSSIAAVNPEIALVTVERKDCFSAILEAMQGGIALIICHTKDLPKKDLIKIKELVNQSDTQILGPGSFGIISPGEFVLGIFPDLGIKKGSIGLISTSGSVTYEIAISLSENGFGISTAVDLGNFTGLGIEFVKLLKLFDQDPETEKIIVCGNSKNIYDEKTIEYLTGHLSKPLIIYQPCIKKPTQDNRERVGKKGNEINQRFEKENPDIFRSSGITFTENISKILTFIN